MPIRIEVDSLEELRTLVAKDLEKTKPLPVLDPPCVLCGTIVSNAFTFFNAHKVHPECYEYLREAAKDKAKGEG